MNSTLIFFAVIGLGFSFFFSGMEAGVFALSRVRIRRLMRAGSSNARRLYRYLEDPEGFLWTILAGNVFSNFAVASLVVVGSRQWMREHPGLFAGGFVLGVVAFYAFCELFPKMLFRLYPNRLCLLLSWPFSVVHFVLQFQLTRVVCMRPPGNAIRYCCNGKYPKVYRTSNSLFFPSERWVSIKYFLSFL
jgi:Mg2+/Co2+ transporter CorB